MAKRNHRSRRTAGPGHRRQVAVLIDFSRSYGRGLLSGVAKFVLEHYEWSVQSEEWRWTDGPPGWLKTWKGDGVIIWAETPELAAIVRKLRVPAVDVRGSVLHSGLPLINTDNKVVAHLVAEHLIERGFRNYAFCGFAGANYSEQRSRWFQERLAEAGFDCAIYSPPDISRNAQTVELEKRGLLFQDHLARWLKSLPKPVGVMACNDIRGQQVMNACRRLDVVVPEEVAVVGVDNDQIFCELSSPPLTSVELGAPEIGYEAAALLERMMGGGKPPKQAILIPPPGVVSRRSSDVLALSDRGLAAGVRFMREHLFETVTTTQMARAAGMSRSIFNQRFIAQIGRSPKAEVLRLRLARAKELLSVTDWNLAQIAERTGFKYAEYLHSIFTQKIGITPGKYRQSLRQQPNHNRNIRI